MSARLPLLATVIARRARRARRSAARARAWRVLALGCATSAALVGVPAAAALAAGPACVPSVLNRSDVIRGTSIQASPLPDSRDASPRTQISLLGVAASALSKVAVSGSRTGAHSGRLLAYSQGDGASFVPDKPFAAGERVMVVGAAGGAREFAYSFTVGTQDPIPPGAGAQPVGAPGDTQHFVSRPDLQPPTITVTSDAPGTLPGYVFTAPYSGPGQDGPEILDNSGQPVWFDPLSFGEEATNLQVIQYNGAPALSFWQGEIPEQGFGEGYEVVVNSAYQTIARVYAGNGYWADLHDFEIGPNDTALLTSFDPLHCDLSHEGGPSDSDVTDAVYQQLDLKTGLVRQEWHSIDHVSLRNSYQPPGVPTAKWPWDAFHINSVQLLSSGNVLLSSRSTWAVYQVSGATGQVLWELGGKTSSFTMGPGTSTAWQHDATMLANGDISIFDNGAVPAVEKQSRGVVVAINGTTHTATLVSQVTHTPGFLAGSQGNYQVLANGDAFIGWGPVPDFSEFSPSGQLLFDAHMPTGDEAYRAYRFAWTGTPARPPDVAARAGARSALTVYASWNGATGVVAWRVLAGDSASSLSVVATVPRSGFETVIPTTSTGPYVRVQALAAAGVVLGTSAVVRG